MCARSCAPSCWVCGALVQRSPRSCDIRSSTSSTSRGAQWHLHRVELADPASPSTLATCHDLYPFPILSHICLLLSCIVPLPLSHFLLVLFLLFIPYFTAYFVLFPACGCASERWHRSRCPQLNTPATLFPTHFLRILLPLCHCSCWPICMCWKYCTEGLLHAPHG